MGFNSWSHVCVKVQKSYQVLVMELLLSPHRCIIIEHIKLNFKGMPLVVAKDIAVYMEHDLIVRKCKISRKLKLKSLHHCTHHCTHWHLTTDFCDFTWTGICIITKMCIGMNQTTMFLLKIDPNHLSRWFVMKLGTKTWYLFTDHDTYVYMTKSHSTFLHGIINILLF